jgi:benzoyl-CoA reductase/2-hydroxyglutaryl-CoA dehydratase subunit BcrC/BadD/HgdB
LCPLIKASYGFAVADKCPYMYFSDLVVGETTCDGKKKMYELLGKIKDVHVMDLPQTQQKESSKELWRGEIVSLKEKIEAKFDLKITDTDIQKAISERNQERAILKEFYELSRLTPPPMTGLQQLQVLFGSQYKFNHQAKIAELRETISKIKTSYEQGDRPVSADAKRIIVTGCPIGGATEKVVKAIEDSGGVVVAFENCTGAKQFDRQVNESANPIDALAEHYLNIGCSVMAQNDNRLELLARLCQDFKADGVVEMVLQACHTYAIETHTIREFLAERSIPFISLETDYSGNDIEQLKTRSAAFIEML